MVGWRHRLDGHELEQAPGVGDGQGSLACSLDIRCACGPVIPCGKSKEMHEAAFDWMAGKLESWGLPVERA